MRPMGFSVLAVLFAAPALAATTVDNAALKNENDGRNWPAYGRTFSETHYSPLSEINRETVPRLNLAWTLDLDVTNNLSTPLAVDGNVFISSGENHGSALLSLKPTGKTFDAEEAWTSQGASSVLRNEWQTSILLDGHLYGFDNVGSAGPVTHLTCINAATGKRAWQQARFGKGNLIAADGKLFCSTMKGELVVVRATTEKYDELGRAAVIGTTRQAPALANGLLYLRDDKEIVCLDVRK